MAPTSVCPSPRGHRRRAAGFTLIELMVAVAIVGVLLAVALPNYTSHMKKSRRAEAQAYLQTVAARQQQFLVDTRAYAALSAVGVAVPTSVSTYYTVTLATTAGPPATFTLTAAPKAAQVGEKCGTLAITHTGAKTAASSGCW